MKKIIGIIFISLMFCNVGFAKMKLIEEKTLKGKKAASYYMATVCVDGYKFVVAKAGQVHSMGMVQFFEERDGKSLPAKC